MKKNKSEIEFVGKDVIRTKERILIYIIEC